MDKWGLGINNRCSGKRLNLSEEKKQVLAHTTNLTFRSLEWHDNAKEGGPNKCDNRWRG
jgi:hypothetical protein